MCNLGNLWSLWLDFSNRVWRGQLSCPRSFLWRLLWFLLFEGEKQTNLSFHLLRKESQSRQWSSHTGAGICPVVFPEPRKAPWLPRYNFTQIITCGSSLNFISKCFRLRAAMFCLMRFYFFFIFDQISSFPFQSCCRFLCVLDAFFSFWFVQRLQD